MFALYRKRFLIRFVSIVVFSVIGAFFLTGVIWFFGGVVFGFNIPDSETVLRWTFIIPFCAWVLVETFSNLNVWIKISRASKKWDITQEAIYHAWYFANTEKFLEEGEVFWNLDRETAISRMYEAAQERIVRGLKNYFKSL